MSQLTAHAGEVMYGTSLHRNAERAQLLFHFPVKLSNFDFKISFVYNPQIIYMHILSACAST